MPYPLKPGTMYMMPTHFGPMTGPRQGPGGEVGAFPLDRRRTTGIAVRFLTEAGQIEPFLPAGFALDGEPVVEVFASYMTGIDWLAGRGYNVLGVRVPVLFEGREDRAAGPFLMVLWENLADPILTGREQLGFSKIWCELPEPVEFGGETRCTASWLGFRFLDMTLRAMEEADPREAVPAPVPRGGNTLTGMLHYKYVPKTGALGRGGRRVRGAESRRRRGRTSEGVLPGRGRGRLPPGPLGGPADAVHDRERAPRARDQGVPRGDHRAPGRRRRPHRPAHRRVARTGPVRLPIRRPPRPDDDRAAPDGTVPSGSPRWWRWPAAPGPGVVHPFHID